MTTKTLFFINTRDGRSIRLDEREPSRHAAQWLLTAGMGEPAVQLDSFDIVHLYDLLGVVVHALPSWQAARRTHSFEVEHLDQSNENCGGDVWTTEETELFDEVKAEELAKRGLETAPCGKTRVVRVTRQVWREYEKTEASDV